MPGFGSRGRHRGIPLFIGAAEARPFFNVVGATALSADPKDRHIVWKLIDIPAAALGLRAPEKSVLLALLNAYNPQRNGNVVWLGNKAIASRTGLDVKTVRPAKLKLHKLQLIKMLVDHGKPDACGINIDAINLAYADYVEGGKPVPKKGKKLSTPLPKTGGVGELDLSTPLPKTVGVSEQEVIHTPTENGRGQDPGPLPKTDPTPPKNGRGTPTKNGPRIDNRIEQTLPPFSYSQCPKVSDGDHQRKLALPGVVAAGDQAERVRRPPEQQTGETPELDPDEARAQALAAAHGRRKRPP